MGDCKTLKGERRDDNVQAVFTPGRYSHGAVGLTKVLDAYQQAK